MTAEEILQDYFAAYDAPRPFDPKHPEDGTLSRKRDGLPPLPLNAEQVKACIVLLEKEDRPEQMLDLLLNRVPPGTGEALKPLFWGVSLWKKRLRPDCRRSRR